MFEAAARATRADVQGGSLRPLVESMQPVLREATGYEAHFAKGARVPRAVVEGHGTVTLPAAQDRGPSFTAQAGLPLVVTVDPERVLSSAQKVELVWRQVPDGEEHVIPLSDGTRDAATGRLNLSPARIDVPADAAGLLRLSLRTTSEDGRTSSSRDPTNDARISPQERATVVFTDDGQTKVDGTLRPGDAVQLAYDADRLGALFGGGVPSELVASVSFNGGPAQDFPLGLSGGKVFLPTLPIPLDATRMSVWFRAGTPGSEQWDSAHGKNFTFALGTTRPDAEPGWKAELLRSTSFPNLQEEDFVGIGPATQRYNCIAWTLDNREEWVWPGTRVADFDALYAQHGYQPLPTVDLSHDPSVEKVVLYGQPPTREGGEVEVTHGAKMDAEGRFTSKIGTQPLIRHDSAEDLSGPSYGAPIRVYVRPRPAEAATS